MSAQRKKPLHIPYLNLIVLGFLIVSFVLGSIAVVREKSFDIRQRAYFIARGVGEPCAPPEFGCADGLFCVSAICSISSQPVTNNTGTNSQTTTITNTAPMQDAAQIPLVYTPPTTTSVPVNSAPPDAARQANPAPSESVPDAARKDSPGLGFVSAGSVSRFISDAISTDVSNRARDFNPGNGSTANLDRADVHNVTVPLGNAIIQIADTSNAGQVTAANGSALAMRAADRSRPSDVARVGADRGVTVRVVSGNSTVSQDNSVSQISERVRVTTNLRSEITVSVDERARAVPEAADVVDKATVSAVAGVMALNQILSSNFTIISADCPTSSGQCGAIEAYIHASQIEVDDRGAIIAAPGTSQKSSTLQSSYIYAAGSYMVADRENAPRVNTIMASTTGVRYEAQTDRERPSSINSITVTPVNDRRRVP